MTIGDKIRRHRKLLGLTQTQLGERLGVKTNAVSKWECGRVEDIPTSKIKAMAALFGVQASYLIDPEPSSAPLPPQARRLDPERYHEIPILGRISAGLPLYAEEHVEGYTLTDLNGGAEYFALRVKGDSMDALGIKDGYLIIVRRQDQVENGEVAVVLVGDEDATVKRFYATDSTVTLLPQSTNPAHQPQLYDPRRTPVRILGKVVEVKFSL